MIIKVCGLRDGENIRRVERLCPNMMGFICWEGSARYVARRPDYLPGVCKVGVFVNPTIEYVCTKAAELSLDRIQLHGEEPPERCAEIARATGLPIIKAFSIGDKNDISACRACEDVPAIDMFLFDTRCTSKGGSGRKFDWS
ncbi:MAG: phosphoribosylanthranilate isomerase, partial [Prevotella sp.]|nr:phosphoribosylanthranilate isomerase [Prevotella sp.]